MVRIVAPLALVNSLFSQDLARYNAASATGRMMAARQQRLEVDAYLQAHARRDRHPAQSRTGESGRRAGAGVR